MIKIRWCDSFQNPEFHWKALESWIKPQNILCSGVLCQLSNKTWQKHVFCNLQFYSISSKFNSFNQNMIKVRWYNSIQNLKSHWKAPESGIKPQNIWDRSITDPSRKRRSGSVVLLPSADVKYKKTYAHLSCFINETLSKTWSDSFSAVSAPIASCKVAFYAEFEPLLYCSIKTERSNQK